MTENNQLDYYEILQVNQSADSQTIERVFRLLAKRFHPDNKETGDADHFNLVVEAFRVLSDPEERVSYDARYDRIREHQWQVLDQESAGDDVEADRRLRLGILSLLYSTRRQDVQKPGLGTYELERLLGCPEHHMQFHIWYLKENGWIQRLDTGQYAITVSGVDKLVESEIPWRKPGQALLPKGDEGSEEGTEEAPLTDKEEEFYREEELAVEEV
jgi:curved DNA-binding protein